MICDLLSNLRAGLRLVALRPVGPQDFRFGSGQLAALIALEVALGLVFDFAFTEPPRRFWLAALEHHALWVLLVLGAGAAAAYAAGRPGRGVAIAIAILATEPVQWALRAVLEVVETFAWTADPEGAESAAGWLLWSMSLALLLGITARAVRCVGGLERLPAVALAGSFAALVGALGFALPEARFWWTDYAEEEPENAAVVALDAEQVLWDQPERLRAAAAALLPQRPGVVDLYFVGFAADATLDVFRREVEFARELFDRRFDTAGRSLVLLNHPDRVATTPLAAASNLALALERVGRTLDPNEDVVFLFLTGHGVERPALDVHFPPLPLDDLDPERLARMLDASGIGWRVVVVSACFAGGFVAPLRDERALILTAAAADRKSFGCSHEAELTWFGRALFAEALAETHSFEAGFARARTLIETWERERDYEASRPQRAAGAALAPRLRALERRLAQATAR
ncbi:MAG: C13 family peptidase [Myxococcota bacterium]|nr:C13 family peptidase [Myxococcota bacterium]